MIGKGSLQGCNHRLVKDEHRTEEKEFSHQKVVLKEGKQLVRERESNITGD